MPPRHTVTPPLGPTSAALDVTLEPETNGRIDKALRAAMLRRSRAAPGLRRPLAHPRARRLRLVATGDILRLRSVRSAAAPGGEWLLHDLDDGGEVAWGYRPDGVRDVVAGNLWPELLETGDSAIVLVVVWPDDLSNNGFETPTFDLALAWTGGRSTFALPSG